MIFFCIQVNNLNNKKNKNKQRYIQQLEIYSKMGTTLIKNIQIDKSSDSFNFSSFITQTQQFVNRLNSNFNQNQFNSISASELKNNQVFQVQIPYSSSIINQEKQQEIAISRKTNINSLYNQSKKNYKGKIDLTCRRQKVKPIIEYQKKKYILKRLVATHQNYQILSQMVSRSGLKSNKLHINSIIKSKNKNLISLIGYEKQSLGFMCGDNWQFTFVFQYFGQYNLLDEIKLRASQILAKTMKQQLDQHVNLAHQQSFRMSQILIISKFLLQTGEQMLSCPLLNKNQSGIYPKISLSDIIILQDNEKNKKEKKSFKYRNPIESIYFQHRQIITKNNFKNYRLQANRSTFTEQPSHTASSMICHIGICILSLCLLEQCQQQCCNSAGQLCISVVEKKIQEVFSLYCIDNEQKIVRKLCNMIQSFILQGTYEYRMQNNMVQMTMGQAKARCNKLFIEQKHKILKIKPTFSPNSITKTNYTQLLLQSQQSVLEVPKLSKRNTQKNQTVSTNVLGLVNMNQKKQFCSQYFSLTNNHQYHRPPIKSHSTNKINNNQGNMSDNENIFGNKLTSFRYSYNKKNIQNKDKNDWNINMSSQKKIQAINMFQPRTKQWSTKFTKNRQQFMKKSNLKLIDQEQRVEKRHHHQRYQSFDEIDKRWRENEQIFKEMPQFQSNEQNLFSIAAGSSIRLSGDIILLTANNGHNNLQ